MGQFGSVACCVDRDSCIVRHPDEDIWHDVDEGDESHDHQFRVCGCSAGSRIPSLYKTALNKTHAIRVGYIGVKNRKSSLGALHSGLHEEDVPLLDDEGTYDNSHNWLCHTVSQHKGEGDPPPDQTSWSDVIKPALKVRDGPNYAKYQKKTVSKESYYACIGVDVVKADCKIEHILDRLCKCPAVDSEDAGLGDEAGGSLKWTSDCPLPRVIVLNSMLPYKVGPKVVGTHPANDHGCSVVATFLIKPETVRMAKDLSTAPNAIKMLAKFHRIGRTDSDGKGGPLEKNKGNTTSCLFKVIGFAENVPALNLPMILAPTVRQYNGKPALVTKSGTCKQAPNGEWLEVDFDVRKFIWLARSMLCSLHDRLNKASLHIGFVIQGCDDDELPENIVGEMRLHNLDVLGAKRIVAESGNP